MDSSRKSLLFILDKIMIKAVQFPIGLAATAALALTAEAGVDVQLGAALAVGARCVLLPAPAVPLLVPASLCCSPADLLLRSQPDGGGGRGGGAQVPAAPSALPGCCALCPVPCACACARG